MTKRSSNQNFFFTPPRALVLLVLADNFLVGAWGGDGKVSGLMHVLVVFHNFSADQQQIVATRIQYWKTKKFQLILLLLIKNVSSF